MPIKFFLLLLSLFCVNNFSYGQGRSSEPILRIENGLHVGRLTEISVDPLNRYLVSVSDDKTVRVWELSSQKLLSILRPPIGKDNDGELFAVAISPDSKTIAVGGFTGSLEERSTSIYIFDRETGRMLTRIKGLLDVIFNLTYSPDGKYLGVSLAGKEGMRVYKTGNYELLGEDSNYGGASQWIDFNQTSDRLITSSNDGFIRLYEIKDNKLSLIAKKTVKGGKEPIGVKFSPDGGRIAVSFYYSSSVTVVSATDLSFLYSPNISKIGTGTPTNPIYFPALAWSTDGRTLYAGGTFQNQKGEFLIHFWTNDGKDYHETVAANGAVFDIDALQSGGIVYGVTNPPGWGILDAAGKRTFVVSSNIPDFRSSQTGLLVNDDASKIQFPFERQDVKPAVFSILNRKLELGENKGSKLKSSLQLSDKLNVVEWNKGQQPSLNGNKLGLVPYERSFALSILPDERSFFISTSWGLWLFDQEGNVLWRKTMPEAAWTVNNSGNGKVAVVGLGDGTIRWYRVSDGQELLAFFTPNDNTGRWILWTPTGYYDASPDAEDLIGWHVNNGRDAAADFFPNHLFKAYFYRPDIIDQILQTTDEARAVKLANEKSGRKDEQLSIAKILPPVVEINSSEIKEVSDTSVKLSYSLRSHSGEPITNLKVLIDGREVDLPNSDKKTIVGISELTIQIPKKDSELTLIAENRFTKSLPTNIKFRWKNQ